jgi:methionine sulfoxide reductase heme-binding subunit
VLQLWFVSRALGAMALLLLSLVIVLGILHNTSVVKNAELGLPRFVLVALHRNLSLLTVVFVALHVTTVIVTDYVHLRVIDVFVPGIAPFNPIAAALGTVATDLLLAIIVTSVLRQRISRRIWFWVHWTSYLCWPVAVVHAVLNVIPRGTTWWTLAIPLLSMVGILVALVYRRRDRRRVGVPMAERGKVSEVAIKQVTGEIPIPGRAPAGPVVDPEAETELLGVVGPNGTRSSPSPRPRPTPRPPAGQPSGSSVGPAPAAGGVRVGRHRPAGEDGPAADEGLDARTEVLPPVEGRTQRGVVPLAPRSDRR